MAKIVGWLCTRCTAFREKCPEDQTHRIIAARCTGIFRPVSFTTDEDEIEWLRLMLKTYQRTKYPLDCCPWEQAMRNRLNEVAGQGQLFLHGKIKGE